MTVEECKKLCPDFSPVRSVDGKVKCSRLQPDGEMCYLPSHFRCELRIHLEREAMKSKGIEPYSVTRLTSFGDCPRKYYLSYIVKAEPPEKIEAFILGSAFASARAKIDEGQEWNIDHIKPEVDLEAYCKLIASLKTYEKYKELLCPGGKNEVAIIYTISEGGRTLQMRGFLDKLRNDQKTIVEWKYAAGDYTKEKISRQAVAYLLGVPEADEVEVAVAHKTRYKLKGAETEEDFISRLLTEYNPASKVFTIKTFKREEFDVETEKDWFFILASGIEHCRGMGKWPANYSSCTQGYFKCQWLPYCSEHRKIGCSSPQCSHPTICNRITALGV